jgi:hypothetical protein
MEMHHLILSQHSYDLLEADVLQIQSGSKLMRLIIGIFKHDVNVQMQDCVISFLVPFHRYKIFQKSIIAGEQVRLEFDKE